MILDLKTTFSYKCPACFSFLEKQISIFDIPDNSSYTIKCGCGFTNAEITRSKNYYNITVPCFICGEEHMFKISKKRFWKSDLLIEGCSMSDLDVCAMGKTDQITKWIKEYSTMLDSLIEGDFEE